MESKSHRKSKVGRKADKRKTAEQKKAGVHEESKAAKLGKNPRAFAFQSAGKAKAQRARSAEKEQRRLHGVSHLGTQISDLTRLGMKEHGHDVEAT